MITSRRESLISELFSPLRGPDARYSDYYEQERDTGYSDYYEQERDVRSSDYSDQEKYIRNSDYYGQERDIRYSDQERYVRYSDYYGQDGDVRMSSDGLFSPVREPEKTITTDISNITTSLCKVDELMTSSPEHIDSDCISVELLNAPDRVRLCQFSKPCSEVEENSESFDWELIVENMQKPVRISLETEVELVEDCHELEMIPVPVLSSTRREDDFKHVIKQDNKPSTEIAG